MMLVAIIVCDRDPSDLRDVRQRGSKSLILLSAIIDVIANVLCMVGLHMIGSGLYQARYVRTPV